MAWQVLIAHAEGEEALAEKLAGPIRDAGYEVAHRGTVMVGESVTEEASKVLNSGGPVVLCGTIKALGTGWAHRLVNAARQNQRTRVFAVQMEKDAYVQMLSLDDSVAVYWQDPAKAIQDLIASLQKYYPLHDASPRALESYDAERRYRELVLESCDIIDLANLPETDRHLATRQLELRRLYVPLRVRVEIPLGIETDEELLEAIEQARETNRQRGSSVLHRTEIFGTNFFTQNWLDVPSRHFLSQLFIRKAAESLRRYSLASKASKELLTLWPRLSSLEASKNRLNRLIARERTFADRRP